MKSCILQHDSNDCGIACLVSAIQYHGGEAAIEQLRKESGTGQQGTTLLGLYQAARSHGFNATGYEADIEDIIDYQHLLILHVINEREYDHYILCFGFKSEKFTIWDPAKGLDFLTKESLSKIWKSRKCLGLVTNSSFIETGSRKNYSLQWLKEKISPDINILFAGLIMGVVISVLSIVMAIFTQKLIDKILPSREYKLLFISLIILFILLVTRYLLGYVRQNMLLEQGKKFNVRIIDEFYGLLLNLPKSFFDTRKKGDFIGRLNDTIRIQRVISEFVTTYIIDILIIIVSVTFLFFYSSITVIISVALPPLLYFSFYRWNRKIISSQNEAMAMYANTESNYIDTLAGITEIKGLSCHNFFREKNLTVFSSFQDRVLNLGRLKVTLGTFAGLAGVIYLISVFAIASVDVFESRLTSGELLAVISICSGMLPSILNLSLIAIPLSEVNVALSRMFEFTRSDPEKYISGENLTEEEISEIKLKDISFRYPGRHLLLEGVNLRLAKGLIVSVSGESGGGKSTLAGIIMRFYEPESGNIIINGNLKSGQIPLEYWRSKVGIIPQDIHIFNSTILENILQQDSEKKINELIKMINEFGLTRFFDSFPAGILTRVGEDGLSLSGGQKQIIAFVRALFRKPDFLIIDEGTSSLDKRSEDHLIRIISMIKRNTGILMISHKGDLIKEISDQVYILENGVLSCMSVSKSC